jgi:hypothetical protein
VGNIIIYFLYWGSTNGWEVVNIFQLGCLLFFIGDGHQKKYETTHFFRIKDHHNKIQSIFKRVIDLPGGKLSLAFIVIKLSAKYVGENSPRSGGERKHGVFVVWRID